MSRIEGESEEGKGPSKEEEEEGGDEKSSKFRQEGQLMQFEDEPTFEGYVYMKGNKRQGWKRRWAIVKDEMVMFFDVKQDAIKQGWLKKKRSGTGTLGRCVCVCVCVCVYFTLPICLPICATSKFCWVV